MAYKVTAEIERRARALGITVRPSRNRSKKLDAYDSRGEFIASFGGAGYMDYHLYLARYGKDVADAKRRAYKARHQADRSVVKRDGKYTAGYLADRILW